MNSRREFVGFGLIGLAARGERRITGSFVNESHSLGHQLRDRRFPLRTAQRVRVPVVIVGGGIAGLCAAWRLQKRGFTDFLLLEMERAPGGNSRWGESEVTRYPWAAHYLPVPSQKAALVRELMEELGALREGKWEERFLCFSPQERLYIHGRWQEGIEPDVAQTSSDRAEFARFNRLIDDQRSSGAFTIPMEQGSAQARRGPNLSKLDAVSMEQWLADHGLVSPYLRWYVNYACRDDFGAAVAQTSAWAGIHYFASRDHDDKGPLTWPEGNGWIVQKLAAKLNKFIRTSSPAVRIRRDGRQLRIFTPQAEFIADHIIFAAPTFLIKHLMESAPPVPFIYSPWLTANLTLDRLPRENGTEPAWDNVIYNSPSLGYVVATHMSLRTHHEKTVWTWYYAPSELAPSQARKMLLEKDWAHWKEFILRDLERAHPDLRSCVTRIDLMRMGHAMARPVPGSLASPERANLVKGLPGISFANSDLSSFSIFEEAQYRGVQAADRALRSL